MSNSQTITPEAFENSVNEISMRYAHDPELMRQWLVILMSNTLEELGYSTQQFAELALEYGWVRV